MMYDTIAAIASGSTNQAISIIRISGPESFSITKKIFSGKVGKNKEVTFGKIKDGEIVIDEVLALWFIGPNTFTGEDTVEINAHGGVINTNKILELILANGARIAEPGEFSRRSFLNGKMDLVKAEAINDMIMAKTSAQTNLAVKKFDGRTSNLINSIKEELLKIIANCEVNIDYPEYDDVEQLTTEKLLPALESLKIKIENMVSISENSRFIYEGINVAIVGKPNSGKSSLLNALLGEDKAIVTNIPGTTRDIVEGNIQIGQILLKLKDTAGIHESNNKIEKVGIQKSLNEIKTADLIIHLMDSTKEEDDYDNKIIEAAKNKAYLKVWNKSDIKEKEGISISAKEGKIENLYKAIESQYKNIDLNNENIVTNSRQLSLIKSSLMSIKESIQGLKSGVGPEVVIIDIQKAWDDLANILGKADNETLLDSMFKNFCLGK
ncbi:MAG: tRNA uridine-5-carboxymethylaminomethyl(34) synthesis GTPase MnmE [Mycoplasma sp.]|nr:tRNA uridine-5-carboxymethylaminomethyl(34) synthesis GTPase MnmE [Mycoplasma sp.]